MAQSLGSLVVTLEANMAQFNSNMNRASQQTEQAMQRMDKALSVAKASIVALASAASVGALAGLVKGAIDAADNLRDMAQKTGIAVEDLNGLGFAASQAGGNLESMVAAAGKLNKSIAESMDPASKSAEAFRALGISTLDASGNLKKADVVMADVADQFAKYQDGPEKAALALALFGKAGADMVPLLNEGGRALRENGAYAERYSGQTTALSMASDEFNDTLGRLKVQQTGFANALAAQLLPVLQQISSAMLEAAEQSNGFERAAGLAGAAAKRLAITAADTANEFKQYGNIATGYAAVTKAMMQGDLEGMRTARDQTLAIMEETKRANFNFRDGMMQAGKPTLFNTTMQTFEKGIVEEKALLNTRLEMLQKHRTYELLSEKEYAAGKDVAYNESLSKTRGFYAAQMKTIQDQMRALKKVGETSGLSDLQKRFDETQLRLSLVGSDKPPAPRLAASITPPRVAAGAKAGKSEADRATQEGERLLASLKAQISSYGLVGAAKLEAGLQSEGYNQKLREELVLHQSMLDALDAETAAERKSAGQLKQFVAENLEAQKQSAASFEQFRQSLLSEAEAEEEFHQSRLDAMKRFHEQKFLSIAEFNEKVRAENARYEAVKVATQKERDAQSVAMAGSVADQLYALMQRAGKEQSALGKAAFLVSKGLAVAEILMNTHVAASKAGSQLGIFGIPMSSLILAQGYASAGMVAGMAVAEASAEGGYDIPAGKNPMTQLHEREMVLPRAQADVIRRLASVGGGSGKAPNITIINNGTPQKVVGKQEISPGDWALIVEDAKNATAAAFADPNSTPSRSLARNFNVPRSR